MLLSTKVNSLSKILANIKPGAALLTSASFKVPQGEVFLLSRTIHLSRRTEENTPTPENAVWDPVREFHFRRFSMFESMGYDYECKATDDYIARWIFFYGVSIFMVFTIVFMYYKPIHRSVLHDAARDEAYRIVEENEAAGLPVIDVNYVPPEEIEKYLPPSFHHYTCDVETDYTYYDRIVQAWPPVLPPMNYGTRPQILGAMPEEIRVMNDGSKFQPK